VLSRDRSRLPIQFFLQLSLLALLAAIPLRAQDSWPRFRGSNGSGISLATNLPVRWAEGDIRWKTELPGKGHSSPVVWKERVFVTSGDIANADRYILCLACADGSRMWQKKYASSTFPQNRENSFATSTPAVDSNGVYMSWTTPEAITVTALTLDGREKWVSNLGPFKGRHGSGASPVVYNELVWINNDQDGPSSLIALKADSGAVRYKIERLTDKVSYGTPCLWQEAGHPDQLIFAASSHGLTSINPLNGAINWDCTNLFAARVVSSPISGDGLVICSSGEGGVGRRLVALSPPDGTHASKIVYEFKTGIPNVPTPLAKDGRLYILCDNGLLRCMRAATGEAIWQERLPARFYASPVWAENRLYLTSKAGEVFVIAAADKYQLLAQNTLGEPSFATPAAANGSLFFRTESSLLAIGGHK
jgi:outer membrane protein assembly factor BamB